jgi:hypothetical protein
MAPGESRNARVVEEVAMNVDKLNQLKKTMNFGSTAYKVFQRLILGDSPGLLVVWGGLPDDKVKANKTYFLEMVETFAEGPKLAKHFSSNLMLAGLHELLEQLKPGHYQCVRVKEDCHRHLPEDELYQTPLAVAVALALAGAAYRRGLAPSRKVVVLCDDIHKFMRYNRQANEQFLRDLAQSLDNQTAFTFVGASRLDWDAKAVLGYERALPLGWD